MAGILAYLILVDYNEVASLLRGFTVGVASVVGSISLLEMCNSLEKKRSILKHD